MKFFPIIFCKVIRSFCHFLAKNTNFLEHAYTFNSIYFNRLRSEYPLLRDDYVNVRRIENCFGCPTDRHQVYAIIAAHEYGHQLFFGARHFYEDDMRVYHPKLQRLTLYKWDLIHSTKLMNTGEEFNFHGIVDYMNSVDPEFIYFENEDRDYLLKYMYFKKRFMDCQSQDFLHFGSFCLKALENDIRQYTGQ